MKNTLWLSALAALSVWQACAQQEVRQATITGKSGGPKCTIEVEIDAVADVEIHGATARLHTLAGSPATWRRFECNMPMPVNPANFRFRGIDEQAQPNPNRRSAFHRRGGRSPGGSQTRP